MARLPMAAGLLAQLDVHSGIGQGLRAATISARSSQKHRLLMTEIESLDREPASDDRYAVCHSLQRFHPDTTATQKRHQ